MAAGLAVWGAVSTYCLYGRVRNRDSTLVLRSCCFHSGFSNLGAVTPLVGMKGLVELQRLGGQTVSTEAEALN